MPLHYTSVMHIPDLWTSLDHHDFNANSPIHINRLSFQHRHQSPWLVSGVYSVHPLGNFLAMSTKKEHGNIMQEQCVWRHTWGGGWGPCPEVCIVYTSLSCVLLHSTRFHTANWCYKICLPVLCFIHAIRWLQTLLVWFSPALTPGLEKKNPSYTCEAHKQWWLYIWMNKVGFQWFVSALFNN